MPRITHACGNLTKANGMGDSGIRFSSSANMKIEPHAAKMLLTSTKVLGFRPASRSDPSSRARRSRSAAISFLWVAGHICDRDPANGRLNMPPQESHRFAAGFESWSTNGLVSHDKVGDALTPRKGAP